MTIRPKHVSPVEISAIGAEFNCKPKNADIELSVTGVTIDSRDVKPGDLYVGLPGARQHGAIFAEQALKLGAVAVLTDQDGADKIGDVAVPVLITEGDPRNILGKLSAFIYNTAEAELKTFGVTGTNGKTSVIYLLDALMRTAGLRTAISTTAERRIGEQTIESNLTSPESSELHALLATMAEDKVDAVGLEVSAHAVVRNRLDGVLFDVVAFNNFSQDHLDDFGDMKTYLQAKIDLFKPQHAKKGVVIVDSDAGRKLAAESQIPITTLATEYGQSADWHLAVTRHTIDGVSFVLQGPDNNYFRGRVPIFGEFMAQNAALALVMLHEAGIDINKIFEKLGNSYIPVEIPGRLELITKPGKGPRFYVDYGHTPGSFESMLSALSEVQTGRIIFMFGADGDRDKTKREAMGAIASAGSDILIICDYHPRFEDPQQIRTQLLAGARSVSRPAEIHEIPDPGEAVRFAIKSAGPDDIIVYAGPGHESYMEVAGNMIPYSAREEVRGALREAGIDS